MDKTAVAKELVKLAKELMAAEVDLTKPFHVIMEGGSIGQVDDKKPVRTFDDLQEAKDYAKRMNKILSPGEKSYYRMKYKVIKNQE